MLRPCATRLPQFRPRSSPSGTSIRHGRWPKSGSELMMSDNRARNGTLGAILGAVIAVALAIFLLSGGGNGGEKNRKNDAGLPPVGEGEREKGKTAPRAPPGER